MATRDRQGTAGHPARPVRPAPDEPRLDGAEPRLSLRERLAVAARAGRRMLDDGMPMVAQALAYSTFFAIPSVLLVAVGLFTLLAGPDTIAALIRHFGTVMPAQATSLLRGSLDRLGRHPASGVWMTVVGAVLAVWSTTSAMT